MYKGPLLKPSQQREANGMTPRRNGHSRNLRNVSRYEVLKEKVKTWCEDRFKIGEALAEIQRDKLYREEYSTFEELCETEFDIKRAHAYRLIDAVAVKASVVEMSPMGDKIQTERQARALAPVPVEKRVEVMERVIEQGAVTAKAITETAALIAPPVKCEPEQVHDKTGFPIPVEVVDDWNRAESYAETLRSLSRIKVSLEEGLENRDVIFAEVNNTTISTLKNAYGDLKRVLPYAVCTSCQGRQRSKCTFCKGRGWLSEFLYKTAVPEITRRIREKVKK